MKRSLIIFGLVVVALAVGGWLVFRSFVAAPTGDSTDAGVWDAGAIALDPEPAPEPDGGESSDVEPAPYPDGVKVLEVTGKVERKRAGEEWKAVTPGERLDLQDAIKTDKDSSAKLQVDEKSEIELEERSELAVRTITEAVHQYKLVRGRVKVDYQPSGERLIRIESEETGAIAEAKSGSFTALTSSGSFTVASRTGQVKLTAREKTVQVDAGQMSSVVKDEGPGPAMAIPASILLRVANPESRVQRARHLIVNGSTTIGARVWVNEAESEVDRRGRFSKRISLREGKNRVIVISEDVAGNRKTHDLGVIIVDPTAPIEKMQIQWGKD